MLLFKRSLFPICPKAFCLPTQKSIIPIKKLQGTFYFQKLRVNLLGYVTVYLVRTMNFAFLPISSDLKIKANMNICAQPRQLSMSFYTGYNVHEFTDGMCSDVDIGPRHGLV